METYRFTTAHSVYEVDYERKSIRRVSSDHEPTANQVEYAQEDGWAPFQDAWLFTDDGNQVRLEIVWEPGRRTITSPLLALGVPG